MFLANTLSKAFLPKGHVSVLVHELEEIGHWASLPVSDTRWEQIDNVSVDDPVFQELQLVIQCDRPLNRADVAQCLYPYFDIQDELTLQGKLVFKAQQLVVPVSLRKELIAATHASHIGVEACIWRAHNSLFCPRITMELKECNAKCNVCMVHCSEQSKEPIQQHDFASRALVQSGCWPQSLQGPS